MHDPGDVTDPIYLDSQSTTPIAPEAFEAMRPYLTARYGHPASKGHAFGWDAEKAVETARAQIADLIGAEPREIVYTSGGTEADNLAVKGVAEALETKGRHLVTTGIENRPVLDCCAWLQRRGWEITVLRPDAEGRIDPAHVAGSLRDDTVLVSVQTGNHEVGTIQDVAAIGSHCRERGVTFHTDATQAAAWIALDVERDAIDLLSLSANKLYGPKGVGALYVRRKRPRARLAPQIHGGGHERGLRSGTVDVAGAAGFGAAAALVRAKREEDVQRVTAQRDALERGIVDGLERVRRLGPALRLPCNVNLVVDDVEGESILVGLPQIALATGSACTTATLETSHVLRALGLDKQAASSSVRFSLSRYTTDDEITTTVASVLDVVPRLRAMG